MFQTTMTTSLYINIYIYTKEEEIGCLRINYDSKINKFVYKNKNFVEK